MREYLPILQLRRKWLTPERNCHAHHGREHPPEELADGACNPDLPGKGQTSQDCPSEDEVAYLDQASSRAVPIGSCGGQHVNNYISLLYTRYVLSMNTDLKTGQSLRH